VADGATLPSDSSGQAAQICSLSCRAVVDRVVTSESVCGSERAYGRSAPRVLISSAHPAPPHPTPF
jgi:hypothetical protein